MDGHIDEDELAIQDRVLVETEIYGRSVPFRAVVVRLCPTELWLGIASPDRRLETLRPNQSIRITVARPGAALLGRSEFLRPLGGSKSRIFAVDRPEVLKLVQRRSYVRYAIGLPVRFCHVDPATWEPRGKIATTMTRNLSPGGVLFVANAPVSVGDDLDLTLPLSGGDRVSMNGVVRRLGRATDDLAIGSDDRVNQTEVAVKFTRITAFDQDRIVRLILLAEHRRRLAALHESYEPRVGPSATLP
jgi:c-di-GMP-binding flagellar brake protein YcgR